MQGGVFLLIVLIGLILLGMPVALSMGLAGILGIFLFGNISLFPEVGRILWWSNNSWVMVCVPFFLIMAEFVGRGQLADRMFEGLLKVTAGVRGALAMVVVTACALMGLTTGGGVTEIAAIGRISIPAMLSRGYDKPLTLGSIASSAALGFLVPPSIFLVIYGSITGISVAELFAAGMIPGFVMAFFLFSAVVIWVRLNPKVAPVSPPVPMRERVQGAISLWPIIALGSLVLAGIFLGVTTPTEVAGMGALLAVVFILIIPHSRKLVNRKFFSESLIGSVRLTATIMFIMAGAQVLGYAWGYLGVPESIGRWVNSLGLSSLGVMVMIYIVLLVAGCAMDGVSMLVLSTPILLPLSTAAGYSPVWFGVMMGMLIGCGQITPPVGMSLFTVKAIFPEEKMSVIILGTLPFLVAELACIVVLTAWPGIALWLPHVMYGTK